MALDTHSVGLESTEDELDSPSRSRSSEQGLAALGAALRAVLSNSQACELNLALKALGVFRDLAGEIDTLPFEDVLRGLRELGLALYVDGGSAAQVDTAAFNLGDGEEARRQLRLWSAASVGDDFGSCDEQSFMWLAWRGRRFVDTADLLWPLFSALDADHDGHIHADDIDLALHAAGMPLPKKTSYEFDESDLAGLSQLESEESADVLKTKIDSHKFRSELSELLAYHGGGDSYVTFSDFVALVCDAQDKFALHQLSAIGPASLVARYDQGVIFMRPEELSCFALPGHDPEHIEKSPRHMSEQKLLAATSAAKEALMEARAAKKSAEAAHKSVKEHIQYLDSPGSPFRSESSPSSPSYPQNYS